MEKKIYKCWCHVCGRESDHESEFMAVDTKEMPDGTILGVITCNIEPPFNQHSREEIHDSYWNGYKALRPNSLVG
jgi:hypothetical protein